MPSQVIGEQNYIRLIKQAMNRNRTLSQALELSIGNNKSAVVVVVIFVVIVVVAVVVVVVVGGGVIGLGRS